MIHWYSIHVRCCDFADDAYSIITIGCTPRLRKWPKGFAIQICLRVLARRVLYSYLPAVPRERFLSDGSMPTLTVYCNDDVVYHTTAKMEALFLAAARRARRMLREAEDRASIDEDASVETAEDTQPHPDGVSVHGSQGRPALCAGNNNPNSSMCNASTNGKDVETKRKVGPQGLGGGGKAGGEGKKKRDHDEEEQVHEDPIIAACKKASARAVLHLALWSQMAFGNFDMDLRR